MIFEACSSRMFTEIKNIKISINCCKISLDTVKDKFCLANVTYKENPNFLVFKTKKKIVFTIFKAKNESNHINITGIKSIDGIEKSLNRLDSLNIFLLKKKTLKVDNITGSLDLKKELFLRELINKTQTFQSEYKICIRYNNETFPGAFFQVKKEDKKVGTILIFHSGKVVFVGCRNLKNIECLESLTLALTQMR